METCVRKCRIASLAMLSLSVCCLSGCGKSDSGGNSNSQPVQSPGPAATTPAATLAGSENVAAPTLKQETTLSEAEKLVSSAADSLSEGMERLDAWMRGEPGFDRKQVVTLTESELPELLKRISRVNEQLQALKDEARIYGRVFGGTQEVREEVLAKIESGTLTVAGLLQKWKSVGAAADLPIDTRNAIADVGRIRKTILEGDLTLGDLDFLTRVERFAEAARKYLKQQSATLAEVHRLIQPSGILVFAGSRFKGPFTKFEDVPRFLDLPTRRESASPTEVSSFAKAEREAELKQLSSASMLGSAEKMMEFETGPAMLVSLKNAADGRFDVVDVVGGNPITKKQLVDFFEKHPGQMFAYVTFVVEKGGNGMTWRRSPFTTLAELTKDTLLPAGGYTVEEAVACAREYYMSR